jgi:hypothetical protein
MKPNVEQLEMLKKLGNQFPEFGDYLTAWRQGEMETLAYGVGGSLDVMRGRIQSLTELQQAIFGRGKTP